MTATTTVLGRLLEELRRACVFNRNDQIPPAVLLWPDAERQWEPLLPRLRGVLPHLLTLGAYDLANRTGPAVWVRCMLARTLPDSTCWPDDVVPVLYLPGVGRAQLRAVEDCPEPLQPLASLQYRGAFWAQTNGRDWTVAAFLKSERGGLDLDLAGDAATQESLRTALAELMDVEVAGLTGKQLADEDFRKLLVPDPVRALLRWLNDPAGTQAEWDKARWKAFRSTCKKQYDFDPESDGEQGGAERLGLRAKQWAGVWQRFAESPALYPHLPGRLRAARPKGGLFTASEAWPQDNERAEQALREGLLGLAQASQAAARDQLALLEQQHAPRRGWVWARLGQAPLAGALRHLTALAEATPAPLNASNIQSLADAYVASGWRADAAMIDALAAVRSAEDMAAVCVAVRVLYEPWLRDTTQRFQELALALAGGPTRALRPTHLGPIKPGTCVLFADGLRYDVGRKLCLALEGRGLMVEAGWHWSALPPVTPTAKPAVSPVADQFTGSASGEEFRPLIREGGKKLTSECFQSILEGQGYQLLKGEAVGDPTGRAWTERGRIDRAGHDEGSLLARRIEEEVTELAERVGALLAAGWKTVQVVTDHGWLLLPGGLPKVELAAYLAENRWGRCAVVKEGATTDVPRMPWHWAAGVWVAVAPGIGCFVAGKEYAHGSLSLQECLVPTLKVRATAPTGPSATVKTVKWGGLRCKVTIEGVVAGLQVALRTKLADAGSTLAGPKEVGADGTASLPVEDDGAEGSAVLVVLLSSDGRVLDKQTTTVGGEG